MSIVALDLGSTSVKAVVILDDGTLADAPVIYTMPPVLPGPPDGHEVDAEVVLAAVTDLVAEVARHPSGPGELWISGQMGGYIAPDSGATPRFVSWQDRRGERPVGDSGRPSSAVLLERLGERWRTESGVGMKPGLPLANLWWDHTAGRLPVGSRPLTLGGFLALRWCGVRVIEPTQAAATGMLDTSTGRWSDRAIGVFDGCLAMPELVAHEVEIGIAEFDGRRLAVHPEVGDHHAAVLGALDGEAISLDAPAVTITIGTAGLAARAVSERVGHVDREVRPFFGGWLEVVTRQPGGWQLAALADSIRREVESLTGGQVEPGALWAAVDSVVFQTPVADTFAHRYARAVELLMHGGCADVVIHTGGVLSKNARLRDHIDARIGARSVLTDGEATLAGLGVLARRRGRP